MGSHITYIKMYIKFKKLEVVQIVIFFLVEILYW